MDKIQIIEKLFYYIVISSYLLLPLAYFFSKRIKKDIIPIAILGYGIVCFILLLVFEYLPFSLRKYYFTTYTAFEYSTFAFIIWKNIKTKGLKTSIVLLSICFFIFQITYLFFSKRIRLDSIPIGIETILILIYSFFLFYEFSKKTDGGYIYNHYCFWLTIGILIYLGGSFFFYILFNNLSQS